MKYKDIIIASCVLFVVLMLVGCSAQWQNTEENVKSPQHWLRAAEKHRCSEEAMTRAEEETAFCAAHTGHSGGLLLWDSHYPQL